MLLTVEGYWIGSGLCSKIVMVEDEGFRGREAKRRTNRRKKTTVAGSLRQLEAAMAVGNCHSKVCFKTRERQTPTKTLRKVTWEAT